MIYHGGMKLKPHREPIGERGYDLARWRARDRKLGVISYTRYMLEHWKRPPSPKFWRFDDLHFCWRRVEGWLAYEAKFTEAFKGFEGEPNGPAGA